MKYKLLFLILIFTNSSFASFFKFKQFPIEFKLLVKEVINQQLLDAKTRQKIFRELDQKFGLFSDSELSHFLRSSYYNHLSIYPLELDKKNTELNIIKIQSHKDYAKDRPMSKLVVDEILDDIRKNFQDQEPVKSWGRYLSEQPYEAVQMTLDHLFTSYLIGLAEKLNILFYFHDKGYSFTSKGVYFNFDNWPKATSSQIDHSKKVEHIKIPEKKEKWLPKDK